MQKSNEEWREFIGKAVKINKGVWFGYVQDVKHYENPKTSALYLAPMKNAGPSQWSVVWLHEIKSIKELKTG